MAEKYLENPTFDLPTGSSVDVYLCKEVSSDDVNNIDVKTSDIGKILKKDGLYEYPFLLRETGNSLTGQAEAIESSEMRHGRTKAKKRVGNESSEGSHDIEFSPESFDDELEAAFRSKWVRWDHDGQKGSITEGDSVLSSGHIQVSGDKGTYNQDNTGNPVTDVKLLFGDDSNGTSVSFGVVKTSGNGVSASDPFGNYIVHELKVGNTARKYSIVKKIPITDNDVKWQEFRDVQVSSLSLTADINAIVTGSFNLMGANNPKFYDNDKFSTDYLQAENRMYSHNTNKNAFGTTSQEAAEAFLQALKNTTESTDTDQMVTTNGCLYINGHRIQYSSNLTFELNNNLSAKYALFVKGAIAHISPTLDVTGNMTLYFTNGEKDNAGVQFGADDVLNLAADNSNVELVFAFQDAEKPDVIYLFQIFKSTLDPAGLDTPAEDSLTSQLPYTSFAEKAVRCMRIALPKVRGMNISYTADATSIDKIDFKPNFPLSSEEGVGTFLTKDKANIGKIALTATVTDTTGAVKNYAIGSPETIAINTDGSFSVSNLDITDTDGAAGWETGSKASIVATWNGESYTKVITVA